MKDKTLLKNLVIVLVLAALLTVIYAAGRGREEERARLTAAREMAAFQTAFGRVEVKASAAYAFDLSDGKIFYAKNEDAELPIASLTKIMTALLVLEKFDQESIIAIPAEALKTFGDEGLKADESWRVKDLVKFMLIGSSNDAAAALAARYPGDLVADMNAKAGELGLTHTFFFNETGLDMKEGNNGKEYKAGNYGSVKEIAYLLSQAASRYPEIFQITAQKSARFAPAGGAELEIANTNTRVDFLPRVLASKTGSTSRAGGSLAIIFEPRPGRPVVLSVLGSPLEERAFDIIRLGLAVLEYFSSI